VGSLNGRSFQEKCEGCQGASLLRKSAHTFHLFFQSLGDPPLLVCRPILKDKTVAMWLAMSMVVMSTSFYP
jgi:hypothetical protein